MERNGESAVLSRGWKLTADVQSEAAHVQEEYDAGAFGKELHFDRQTGGGGRVSPLEMMHPC